MKLSRRTLLRGAGAAVALPWMESLAGARPADPPARLAFLYLGTGWNTRELFPKTPGAGYETTPILKPLEKSRGAFTVIQGMALEHGGGHDGDVTFLTGSDAIARVRAGQEFKNSVSCDQVAAAALGRDTRFPSLELSERRGTGFGGQGLATIAWSEHGVPLAAENDPRAIFDRLFGADGPERRAENERRFRQRRSVLDGLRDKAKELEKTLGAADRERLDQYFSALREVEKQLEREIAWSKTEKPKPDLAGLGDFSVSQHPEAKTFDVKTWPRLMYDLLALAWRTDSTRVATYVVRRELHSHYPGLEATMDYHSLTHHGNDPKKLDDLARIDAIYMEHFAHFLERLRSIQEGEGTLLDRCLIGVSSGMGMGHSRNQLPTIVAGGRALGLKHAGFLRYEADVPLANLWTTMLERAGVKASLKGATGPLKELA